MARLSVAAAGNAEENINLINARFMAEALRRIRGYDTGVLDNSFFSSLNPKGLQREANADFMWKLTATNVTDVTVGRGMATAYGFDIQSEETVHFTLTAPSAGTKYVFVYLEWDFSNPVEANGKIDIHDNGTSATWTPSRQDNLITNPIGVYQMPLYRIAVTSNGVISSTANWNALGVLTIGYNLRANYANRAEDADEATHAVNADKSITRATSDKSTNIATTKFVSDFVNFGSSTFTLAGVSATVKRAAKYVYSQIRGWITWNKSNINAYWTNGTWGTLPEGYRPSTAYTVPLLMTERSSGFSIMDGNICAIFVLTVNTDGKITTSGVLETSNGWAPGATVYLQANIGHVVS